MNDRAIAGSPPLATQSKVDTPVIRVLMTVGKSVSSFKDNPVRIVDPELAGYDAEAIAQLRLGLSQRGTVHRGSFTQYIEE